MAEKAISVRLDAEAQTGARMDHGTRYSQSEAIREALIRAARLEERAQTQADAKRIANDPVDRAEIAAIQEFFGELELPPG